METHEDNGAYHVHSEPLQERKFYCKTDVSANELKRIIKKNISIRMLQDAIANGKTKNRRHYNVCT